MGRDRQIYNIEHFNLLMKLRHQFVNYKSRIEILLIKTRNFNIIFRKALRDCEEESS